MGIAGASFAVAGLGLILLLGAPPPATADPMTSEQAEAILTELKQIRQLLQRQPGAQPAKAGAPRTASVSMAGAYALGREDAPLTLVEFTDLECPFCRHFHLTTFEQLKKAYVDTGRVRFVSRDMPLPMHPHAQMAAEAARCAGEQGKFWEARHALMAASGELSDEAITKLVGTAGVDGTLLKSCLDSLKYRPAVKKDLADAQAAAISGTPTFVLGRSSSGLVAGELIVGAQPYAVFDGKIRELLGTAP